MADDLLLRIAAAFNPAGIRAVRQEAAGLGRFVEDLSPALKLDVGDALGDVKTVRGELDGIADEDVALRLDPGDALADVGEVRAELDGIADEDVALRLDDSDARSGVAGLRTALKGIPDEEVALRVSQEGTADLDQTAAGLGAVGSAGHSAGLGLGAAAGGGKALAGAGSALAGAGLLSTLFGLSTGGAELADSVNAVNVVFGEASGAVIAFGDDAAKSVGLSTRSFNQLTAPIGGLLSSLGFLGDEQASMSIDAVKLGGDFASVYGGDIPKAVQAVGAAFRGETEPIRAYGISLDEATVKAEASRLGLIKLSVDADAVARAQLNVEKAQKAASDAHGNAPAKLAAVRAATLGLESAQRAAAVATREHGAGSVEARTAAEALATAQEKLTAARAKTTGGGIEAKEAALNLKEAQDKLKEALAGDSAEMDKNAKARATWSLVTKQAGDVQGDFSRTSSEGVNATRVSSAAFDDAKDKLGTSLVPLLEKGANAATFLSDAFGKLPGPVQAGTLVLVGLLGVGALLGPMFLGISAALSAHAAASAASAAASTTAGAAAAGSSGGFFAAAAGLWAVVAPALIAAAPFILVGAAVAALAYLFVRNFGTIKEVAGSVWGKLQEVWDGIIRIFGTVKDAVVGFVKEWGLLFLGPIGVVIKFKDEIFGFFKGAVGWLLGIGRDIVGGLINGLQAAGSKIGEVLVGLLPGPLKKFANVLGLGSPSRLFAGYGRNVGEGFVIGLQAMAGDVEGALVDLTAGAGAGLAPVAAYARGAPPGRARAGTLADVAVAGAGPTFNVYPSAGMDEADLARRVALEQAWAARSSA